MQQILIRYLLDPLAKSVSRLSPKVKDAGFIGSFLLIFLLFMGKSSGLLNCRYIVFFALGCLGLGGMILFALPAQCKPVVFRKNLLLIWFGIGALMLLSGVLYNVDYLPEALLFLVVYPVIFLVWNQSDVVRIFKLLLQGIELSFWLYALVCLLFYPVNENRYSGLFTNVNATAGYLALVAVCLLADSLWAEKLTAKRIRKILAISICIALLLYTSSRTGILALAVVAIAAVAMGLLFLRKRRRQYFLRNALLIAVSSFLFFQTTIYVFRFGYSAKTEVVSWVQSLLQDADQPNGSQPSIPGQPADPQPSTPGQPADPQPSTPGQPVVRPEDFAGVLGDRFDSESKDLTRFTSGRTQIWLGYVKQLNLFGHADSGTVIFVEDGTEKTYHSTHMTILQVAYENGLLAGLLYLAFNLVAGFFALRHALQNKEQPHAMLPLFVSLAYGVHSLLANTGISFWYLTTLMYYLVQFPIMKKPEFSAKNES